MCIYGIICFVTLKTTVPCSLLHDQKSGNCFFLGGGGRFCRNVLSVDAPSLAIVLSVAILNKVY